MASNRGSRLLIACALLDRFIIPKRMLPACLSFLLVSIPVLSTFSFRREKVDKPESLLI
jgi:hypothetical protein